ncbi:hypothetical protein [Mesorhizobium sp. 10J20-29]
MKGRRRCRMHGGTNPGAPKCNRNAWKHGGRSALAIKAARYLRNLSTAAECRVTQSVEQGEQIQ